MRLKSTGKHAQIFHHNHHLDRAIYEDKDGNRFISINGHYFPLESFTIISIY